MPATIETMRRLRHPGAPLTMRIRSVAVRAAPPIKLVVPAGQDLFETVHSMMASEGVGAASFRLVSGIVEHLRVMTGGPGADGLPMDFHGPHLLAGPLAVVAGAAGVGIDENGRAFTHCHAAFRDRNGRLVGGHLIAGETVAGTEGITLDFIAITGGRFERKFDTETHFTLFHPEAA